MGDNALKYAKTERKNPAKYNIINEKVLELLKSQVFCETLIETPEKIVLVIWILFIFQNRLLI